MFLRRHGHTAHRKRASNTRYLFTLRLLRNCITALQPTIPSFLRVYFGVRIIHTFLPFLSFLFNLLLNPIANGHCHIITHSTEGNNLINTGRQYTNIPIYQNLPSISRDQYPNIQTYQFTNRAKRKEHHITSQHHGDYRPSTIGPPCRNL